MPVPARVGGFGLREETAEFHAPPNDEETEMRRTPEALVFVSLIPLCAGAAMGVPSFTPLPFEPGEDFSLVTSVSDDGRFIGGHTSGPTATGFTPIIWDGLARNTLSLPTGFEAGGAYINAISGDGGSAVAIGLGPDGFRGIRWDSAGMPHVLSTAPGTFSSFNAINFDGSVAGGFVNQTFFGPVSDALVWTSSGGEQNIGNIPGFIGEASITGVSNDGSLFVGFATQNHQVPVTWTQSGGFEVLPGVPMAPPGPHIGMAIDVSADGSTIVGALEINGRNVPTFWDSTRSPTLINLIPGYQVGEAVAATNDGSIVVGHWRETPTSDELGSLAFIWDADNGARPLGDVLVSEFGLDLQGWTLNVVNDITPDGLTMVGSGLNPMGELQAFRVVIPAPGALGALAISGLLLARRRR